MAGGGVTGQCARDDAVARGDDLKSKKYVFDPVNGRSVKPMFGKLISH